MSDDWASGVDPHATLREKSAVLVATGRRGHGEIIDRLTEEITDPDPRLLNEYVDRAFARHLRAQRHWPIRTDVDRLERAGQALAAIGVCYFEALACCDGCLNESGGDVHLWRLAAAQDPRARALVYCFDTDIELALAGEGLWLHFDPGQEGLLHVVAKEILDVLHAHGLDALWPDESVARLRIDMEWRCRRLGQAAAHPGPEAGHEPLIDVTLTGPVGGPLPWWGRERRRRAPVREFTRLFLPWLPAHMVVTVTSPITGGTLTLDRDFDRIRVVRSGLRLDRDHLDEVLSRWAVDGSLPAKDAPAGPRGLLEVGHDDPHPLGTGSRAAAVPLGLAECKSLLYRTTSSPGAFLVFHAHNGECVQFLWQDEHELWMESPDQRIRVSHGRLGTLADAEDLICRLAEEGVVGLSEMEGVHTIGWD